MKYYILILIAAITGVTSAQQKNDSIVKIKIDKKVVLPFGELEEDRLIGAVDAITADDISHTSDYNVESTLAGQVPGLIVTEGFGSPGIDRTSLKVRGQSRGGQQDFPLIVVDGIANRSLSSLSVDEIESISVLKDITAKMLYGSKAANGVLIVTTKRGYNGKKKVNLFTETGFKTPTALPEYLGSADYARLYNQARTNDGLDPIYTSEDINNYANNPSILYPNVDFHDQLLKRNAEFLRFNAQLVGGDNETQYFLNVGYIREKGLEKLKTQTYDRINVRSNLNYKVNNTLSMFLDIAGRMDIWERANIDNETFFSALSSHRPNDYALWVGAVGDNDNLGWSPRVNTNLVGELTRSGYINTKNYYAQTNLGGNLDLNNIIKGLTASAYVTFDVFNSVLLGKQLSYSRVNPIDGIRDGVDQLTGDESRAGDDVTNNLGLVGKINYARAWGNHDLHIDLSALQQTLTNKSTLDGRSTEQDDKNMNVGLRTNYVYNNRYIIEGAFSYMGSDKFTDENRWELFASGGLGWIISNESFLKNSKSINFLKLKGSFGEMGYDGGSVFDYLLDRDFYISSGGFRTGPRNNSADFGWRASQIGNPNLTYEKSREFNVGLEATLFNKKVDLEVNYFDQLRYDMPITLDNSLPDYLGALKPVGNFNEVSNKGIDVFIGYKNNIGELKYSLGGNLIYSKAVNEVYDELNQYAHLNRTGKATDVIFGYVDNGLYQNDADIASHGVTSSYGNIIPGDIKYENFINDNGDNIIDQFDVQAIGNSYPRINYSLNLQLQYKNFELFVIGQGTSGFDRMLNNSYYWNLGENKYSVQALNAAVPGNISGASLPRLTSLNQGHSYRNSTYWMVDGDYFKIRTAELSYTLPKEASEKIGSENLKLFVRANDILTFSKIKDLDPENLNAGISDYPMYKTVSLGAKITF